MKDASIVIATPSMKMEQSLRHFLFNQGIVHLASTHALQEAGRYAGQLGAALPVLLLDARVLSDHSKPDIWRDLHNLSKNMRILIMGENRIDTETIFILIQSGASGYLNLPKGLRYFVKAIEAVCNGDFWFETSLLVSAIRDASGSNHQRPSSFENRKPTLTQGSEIDSNYFLTPREKIVAQLVAMGLRNRDVAIRLNISEKTVKIHISRIYEKLGVRNRVQLSLLHFRP